MKSITRFVPYDFMEFRFPLERVVMELVNDLRIALVRAGVNPDTINSSIHVRSMGLMFEMWGE